MTASEYPNVVHVSITEADIQASIVELRANDHPSMSQTCPVSRAGSRAFGRSVCSAEGDIYIGIDTWSGGPKVREWMSDFDSFYRYRNNFQPIEFDAVRKTYA